MLRKAGSRPIVWLGQSADTSSICAKHPELKRQAFLTSLGCAIRKPSLKRTHFHKNLRSILGVSGPLMIDSGGFAISMNPESRWTVDVVGDLIGKIEADIYVSLDFPPLLRDGLDQRKRKIRHSVKNFWRLSDRFPNKKIMPVVHGRNVSEIELCLNLLSSRSLDVEWVGLGGVVPLLQQKRVYGLAEELEVFIAKALHLICQAFPHSGIHVFGGGGTRTFPALVALGATSADSIGWRHAAGFGSVFLPMKSQRLVAWTAESKAPRKMIDDSDRAEIALCRCPACSRNESVESRLEAFRSHFSARSIHNAWIVANQSRWWPKSRKSLQEIVANGAVGPNWAKAVEMITLGKARVRTAS